MPNHIAIDFYVLSTVVTTEREPVAANIAKYAMEPFILVPLLGSCRQNSQTNPTWSHSFPQSSVSPYSFATSSETTQNQCWQSWFTSRHSTIFGWIRPNLKYFWENLNVGLAPTSLKGKTCLSATVSTVKVRRQISRNYTSSYPTTT